MAIALYCSSRGHRRGPRPLKIESSQVAGHIHSFADEKQSRHRPRLHRLRIQPVSIHPAGCHLGLLEAFRACRLKLPAADSAFYSFERRVRPTRGGTHLGQMRRESLRQNLSQCLFEGSVIPPRSAQQRGSSSFHSRSFRLQSRRGWPHPDASMTKPARPPVRSTPDASRAASRGTAAPGLPGP